MPEYRMTWTNTALRRAVFAKTGGRCFFCGVHVKLNEDDSLPRDWLILRSRGNNRIMVPDHAYPKVRGGEDRADNRVPACRPCNTAKGALTVDEFRFVRAFRTRDLNFRFHGEEPAEVERNWLCVYSDDQERTLFVESFPWASVAYARGRRGALPGGQQGPRRRR